MAFRLCIGERDEDRCKKNNMQMVIGGNLLRGLLYTLE